MQPDVDAVYRSPRAPLKGGAAATRAALQASPICLIPRLLDPETAAALDALPADDLPRVDTSGPLPRVRAAVRAAVAAAETGTVLAWLREDILALVEHYAAATGSRALRVRLQAVGDDMCRAFHVDNVTWRLVTTYRGPGTQWLAPGRLRTAADGEPIGPQAIRVMGRGTVAILRGSKGATPERPGLLHRSPPIAGTGVTRLFLAINEVMG